MNMSLCIESSVIMSNMLNECYYKLDNGCYRGYQKWVNMKVVKILLVMLLYRDLLFFSRLIIDLRQSHECRAAD